MNSSLTGQFLRWGTFRSAKTDGQFLPNLIFTPFTKVASAHPSINYFQIFLVSYDFIDETGLQPYIHMKILENVSVFIWQTIQKCQLFFETLGREALKNDRIAYRNPQRGMLPEQAPERNLLAKSGERLRGVPHPYGTAMVTDVVGQRPSRPQLCEGRVGGSGAWNRTHSLGTNISGRGGGGGGRRSFSRRGTRAAGAERGVRPRLDMKTEFCESINWIKNVFPFLVNQTLHKNNLSLTHGMMSL